MMNYMIIERTDGDRLAYDVAAAMANGWVALGGVAIAYDYRRAALVYAQAMVKP